MSFEVFYEGALITRKEAKNLGLKRYFTGKPCKHGHVDERYVNAGNCCRCSIERTRNWRSKPEDEKFTNNNVAKPLPPRNYLLLLLDYNPLTGKVYWKDRPMSVSEDKRTYNSWRTKFLGKEAGSKHYANGYLEIRLGDNKLHKLHRVIWKIMTGEDPYLPIDHINSIPWDNRWANLRLATHQENSRNSASYSKTGYKGVTKGKKGTWSVSWCVEDVSYFEYYFKTPEDAARRYDEIVSNLYGDYAKLNFPEE